VALVWQKLRLTRNAAPRITPAAPLVSTVDTTTPSRSELEKQPTHNKRTDPRDSHLTVLDGTNFLAGMKLAIMWFAVSGASTITAWQNEVEWGLKIAAALVAIVSGAISIALSLKNKRKRRRDRSYHDRMSD
jgi:Flp pilus assembly protein TadB